MRFKWAGFVAWQMRFVTVWTTGLSPGLRGLLTACSRSILQAISSARVTMLSMLAATCFRNGISNARAFPLIWNHCVTSSRAKRQSLLAIGRCLTEPEFDLDQQLCLFARDEVTQWLQMRGKTFAFDLAFRKHVAANIDSMVNRAELMACKLEREQAVNNPLNPGDKPVIQTVTNLVCQATNPAYLNRMAETYHPWFWS